MSLRSAILTVLLLAVLAVAQTDIFVSYWINVTATKMCALDVPSKCYYVPKINITTINTKTTYIVAVYKSGSSTAYIDSSIVTDYSMLRYITYYTSVSWALVNITRPGLLYTTTGSFTVKYGNSAASSSSYTVCGKTYSYAYYVSQPGVYNITPFAPPHYLLDVNTCTAYRISATSGIINLTTTWFGLYIATMYPNTTKIYTSSSSVYATALNGTEHAYLVQFRYRLSPTGVGFYIVGGTVAPTLAITFYDTTVWYGPRHYSALNNNTSTNTFIPMYGFYDIGLSPSDGVFTFGPASTASDGPYDVTYVANGTIGYFKLYITSTFTGGVHVYARRFDIVDLTMYGVYLYNARGVACPAYSTISTNHVGWSLNRLDRVAEIEICNNMTSTVYAALLAQGYAFYYADKIDPGKCARLRWDTGAASKPPLYIFATARDLCSMHQLFYTSNYNPGWRHFLFSNNTVKPVATISPDFNYSSTWLQLINYMKQQYNATINSLLQALKAQANATQAIQSYIASQPRFTGVIKMDSATSTWLKTVYNELQKYQVSGASSSFGAVTIPAVPTAVAPAAASAVAVAWAASRRDDDVVTAAAVAGIALALFGILMTLIYGTGSLTLVALGIIVAAAAAAWKKI